MSRQFLMQDPTWGEYRVIVIHEDENGAWPDEWRAFQEDGEVAVIGNLFSYVSYSAYQDALHNHYLPLIKELQIPPYACLLKTPDEMKQCAHKKSCAMYDKTACLGDNPKVPTCYQAALGDLDSSLEIQAARVFELWRMGFYIIVVPNDD